MQYCYSATTLWHNHRLKAKQNILKGHYSKTLLILSRTWSST